LIEQVRDVFTGRLSYAANWQWEYPNVRFWGKLDEIGIDAYFELLPADQCLGPSHPSRNALIREWRKHLRNVEKLANAKGLPVLFSEIGYTDLDGTVAEPWKHETSDRLDVLERVAAYSALAEATATQRTWLREIHFWHWGMTGTSGSRYRVSLGDGVSDFLWRWQSGPCSVRPSDEGSETEEGRAEAP
jgi:hypothetical protein